MAQAKTKTAAHQKYYLSDGTLVPGVTTVIGSQLGWNKNALIAWARREALAGQDPTAIADKAANIGTLTHYLVECHIKGTEPDTSEYSPTNLDKAENGFIAFLDWEKSFEVAYVQSELAVISEKHRFGGTVDCIARKNGSLWLLDIKTSSGIYLDHKIQVAAYKTAYEECNQELDEVHILQLGKEDGSFAHHKLSPEDIEYGWGVFQHCLALYRLQQLWK